MITRTCSWPAPALFPTVDAANPTLTIAAVSLRTAATSSTSSHQRGTPNRKGDRWRRV